MDIAEYRLLHENIYDIKHAAAVMESEIRRHGLDHNAKGPVRADAGAQTRRGVPRRASGVARCRTHAAGVEDDIRTITWNFLNDPECRSRWDRKRAGYPPYGILPHEAGGPEGPLIETRNDSVDWMPPALHRSLMGCCSVRTELLFLPMRCARTSPGYQGKNGDAQIQGVPGMGQDL